MMNMNINVALNHVKTTCSISLCVRSHIHCNDGFYLSVQASEFHYCYPRKTQKYHETFEILVDSTTLTEYDKDLLKDIYCDKVFHIINNTDYIYANVPASIVELIILHHGSIDWDKTPRKEKTNGTRK